MKMSNDLKIPLLEKKVILTSKLLIMNHLHKTRDFMLNHIEVAPNDSSYLLHSKKKTVKFNNFQFKPTL